MFKKVTVFIFIVFSFFSKGQTTPWQQVPFPNTPSSLSGVLQMAAINNTIFAASGNGIFSSSNYGQTWNQVLFIDAWSIIADGNTLYVGGSFSCSSIMTSTNAGLTWTNITPSFFIIGTWGVPALFVHGSYLYASASAGGTLYRCPLSNLSSSNWTTFTTGIFGTPDATITFE